MRRDDLRADILPDLLAVLLRAFVDLAARTLVDFRFVIRLAEVLFDLVDLAAVERRAVLRVAISLAPVDIELGTL
jgi:hypothetical protein